jgi:DNA-binding CsgD family transcriptional regulator
VKIGFKPGSLELVLDRCIGTERTQLEVDGLEAAFQQGRSLSLEHVCTLTVQILRDCLQALDRSALSDHAPVPKLLMSPREQEVLHLVAEGLSSKVIGGQLFISPSTVNYHLTSIFNKLGVNTRAQAVASAAERDLL